MNTGYDTQRVTTADNVGIVAWNDGYLCDWRGGQIIAKRLSRDALSVIMS